MPELQLKHTADIRAEQRDVQRLDIEMDNKRRLETSRKQESRMWAENLEGEKLELCKNWREFRKMKNELSKKEMWHELNVREGWKIKAEGRKLKSDATVNKKKRFGKVCKKGLTDLEEELLKTQVASKLELREAEQNLEMYKRLKMKDLKGIPEGRKRVIGVSKGLEKSRMVENVTEVMWDKLEMSMRFIEMKEEWIDLRWLEKSSLDDQRMMKRRLENKCGNKDARSPNVGVGKVGRLRADQMPETENRDAHQVRKAGNCQKEGNCQEDGKLRLEDVHKDAEEASQKLQKKQKETEKVKQSNQVEEIEDRSLLGFDSSMFGRRKLTMKFENSDIMDDAKEDSEEEKKFVEFVDRKKEDAYKKEVLESSTSRKFTFSHESGKMNTEMRATHLRSSASQTLLFRKQGQERSVCGKVMKKVKGGTPQKIKNVEKLKKIFEIGTEEPSLRKGWVELRQRQSVSNPLDNFGATRLELEICVDQLEGGTQNGPRQERYRDGVAGYDWMDAPIWNGCT